MSRIFASLFLALPMFVLAQPLAAQDHSQMDHAAMGHDMSPAPANDTAANDTAAPARASQGPAHAADTIWGEAAMRSARGQLANGGFRTGSFMAERLEARVGDDEGYLWDVQAFYGGDLDRLVLKSEGEGVFGGGIEGAEVQALWSHAISPFFDLQSGVRFDFEPQSRGHAVIGIQGLAPYMIHLDAAAFLSETGDLSARVEAEYDQLITQRLILQPRIEFELAAQDIPERGIGAGLTSTELGLRLRYEITREFAPYVGVEWEQKLGRTRRIAITNGGDPSGLVFLLGLRSWF